jgi:hypothetical protein
MFTTIALALVLSAVLTGFMMLIMLPAWRAWDKTN